MSFKHWYMMRSDSLISLMRIKYLERELKVTIWDDDPKTPRIPVVAIASPSDGHVEVDKVIGVVGLGLSQIPLDTRASEHDPRSAKVQGIFSGQHANILGSRNPNS